MVLSVAFLLAFWKAGFTSTVVGTEELLMFP